jgi:hypothetical protein
MSIDARMDYHDKVCGDCEHWHRQVPGSGPVDLDDVQGECRESPPSVTAVGQTPTGQTIGLSMQPLLRSTRPACSRWLKEIGKR